MRKQYHFRKIGPDTAIWDVHRLVRLSKGIAPEPVALTAIAELDENWWYDGPDRVPTPRSIAAHMKLVQEADLAHPVLLCADGRLMDGMHRAVRALLDGRETISAIRFPATPDPDYVNVPADGLPHDDA